MIRYSGISVYRNPDRRDVKICTGDNGDIGDIAIFANIVMRFFYNNHVLTERRCLFAATLHSNARPYAQVFLV